MTDLVKYSAKVCYTASAFLIYKQKILLVKHKALGWWLPPGGHIDKNEVPHLAAERECWEETSLKVKALDHGFMPQCSLSQSVPTPFVISLHWISKENYDRRLEKQKPAKISAHGTACEQHLNFGYLVKATNGLNYRQNVEETDGIAWFDPDDLKDLDTADQIRNEIRQAFKISN